MDYSKFPHAKTYESATDGGYAYGILLVDDKLNCTFVIFSDEEPHLYVHKVLEYDSLEAFHGEWTEPEPEPTLLIEGSDNVNRYLAWQASGYYMPARGEVDNVVRYANDLADYATALEKENGKLMREKLGYSPLPERPVFVHWSPDGEDMDDRPNEEA